jgi:DNA-binding SARP family transcriptional activator
LERLASAAEASGEWERTLALAQKILREDPFREDAHCTVMRAHAAQGNRVAVKGQYEKLRRLLRRELGVEPAPATRKVYSGLVE